MLRETLYWTPVGRDLDVIQWQVFTKMEVNLGANFIFSIPKCYNI